MKLFIDADQITELDETQAPTGKLLAVEGTPFDFRMMHAIGKFMASEYAQFRQIGTYDHNYVINERGCAKQRFFSQRKAASALPALPISPVFSYMLQISRSR